MNAKEIFQAACNVDENESISCSHGSSLRYLQTLPMTEKVKKLLFQGKWIQIYEKL